MGIKLSLIQFLDVILPADNDLSMPSANEIHLDKYLNQFLNEEQVNGFFELLNNVAARKFSLKLAQLDDKSLLTCVERAKRENLQLVNHFIHQCLTAYYTHPYVLKNISAGAVPPFPEGNNLENDDWLLLEDVYERGPIYRKLK
ncbi:hypothetical protein PP2015_919 [Pseudoalteromonas phenolica]|uniref:Uncharacterized protein n=1 Tax=Pseudoalteromonas phenolica TaxID=161398 RepID=A0A0S2JZC4_9GAMM|nr:hypothetical protein PP2015_919 [Pseudoalteromonas phenolica]